MKLFVVAAVLTSTAAVAQSPLPPNQWSLDMFYSDALLAVDNYRSCGTQARPAALRALNAALRRGEARARARGLDSSLELGRARATAIAPRIGEPNCRFGAAPILPSVRHSVDTFRTVATYGSEGARR